MTPEVVDLASRRRQRNLVLEMMTLSVCTRFLMCVFRVTYTMIDSYYLLVLFAWCACLYHIIRHLYSLLYCVLVLALLYESRNNLLALLLVYIASYRAQAGARFI